MSDDILTLVNTVFLWARFGLDWSQATKYAGSNECTWNWLRWGGSIPLRGLIKIESKRKLKIVHRKVFISFSIASHWYTWCFDWCTQCVWHGDRWPPGDIADGATWRNHLFILSGQIQSSKLYRNVKNMLLTVSYTLLCYISRLFLKIWHLFWNFRIIFYFCKIWKIRDIFFKVGNF